MKPEIDPEVANALALLAASCVQRPTNREVEDRLIDLTKNLPSYRVSTITMALRRLRGAQRLPTVDEIDKACIEVKHGNQRKN